MKNTSRKVATMLLGIVLATGMMIGGKTEVNAATPTATVTGTVAKGTTADTLYLYNSSDGTYTIKLDGETDFNGCKVLTVGKQISVGIYRGNDEYNHAATITAGKQTVSASVDTSNQATVTGKVKDKSTDEILYLDTTGGEMVIKLDSTTNLGGCRVVVAGANVNVVVARGSDAYMHALSISNGSGSSGSSDSVSYSGEVPANTTAVTGTPEDKSNGDMLYLKTKDGTYTLKVDDSADTSQGFVFTSGNKVTAYIYHGSDSYMHAAKVVGTRNNGGASGGSTTTFSGTVESGSTESLLLLNTSGGVMKFKLDGGTTLSGSKGLYKGLQVTVSGSTGSDAYWHAVSIAAKSEYQSSGSSSSYSGEVPSNTTAVTGTPEDKSTSSMLYLKTKDGTYSLKIDDSSDTSNGFIFTSGNSVTAYIYHGSDAYMHAAKVVGTRNGGGTPGGSTTTFTGTVDSSSTESMLYLNTSGGTMKFKIDGSTSLSGAKGLNKGRAVTVSGAIGSDSYWHAASITAR